MMKNVEDIYQLSPAQEAMLASARLGQVNCALSGALDVAALEWAWQQVLNRHSILRTSFVWKRLDKPLQVVNRESKIAIQVHDSVSKEDLNTLRRDELEKEIDPSVAPLARVVLCRVNEDLSHLILTYHPLILDERSVSQLLHEVLAYYASAGNGRSPQLASGSSFWSYVSWVKEQDHASAENFWRESLQDFESQTPLEEIYSHGDLAGEAIGYDQVVTEIEPDSFATLAERLHVTVETLMHAAWALLLHRETGDDDFVYGYAHAPANLAVLGPLSTIAPVRVRIDAYTPAGSWINSLQDQFNQIRGNPFYNPNDLPPLQTVVSDQLDDRIEVHGSTLKVLNVESLGPANVPIVVNLPTATAPQLRIRYDRTLFGRETIETISAHFQTLLTGLISNPDQRVLELPFLTTAELEQLSAWNQTATDYPRDTCVHQLFEEQAEARPAEVAVVFEDQQLTYAELNARANQLAHHLRALGVQPETRIALCVERSLEMLVGMLGILKSGGAFAPLDPAHPLERLSFMLDDLQAPVVLTQEHLLDRMPAHWGQVLCLDADWQTISLESTEDPINEATADNLAYVMYTSGSTGTPKGVSVSHRAVVRLVKNTNYLNLGPDEVFLQFAPISFDASTLEIWGPLLNGGRLAVMSPSLPSLEVLGAALRKHGVNSLWLTAGLFHLMVDERLQDLRSIRQLVAGGDALSAPHVRKAFEGLPSCRLINGYGPTEGTTFTCCYPVQDMDQLRTSVPIGRPISNTQSYILDRHLRPVPAGVTGELYIGGDGLARDYVNRPDLTAERFVPSTQGNVAGARLYKTGDLVRYLPDGNIQFLGRRDLQVKIRGFRIELGEVEATLSSHPALHDAVVLARSDIAGEKQLVAYVVGVDGKSVSNDELRDFLRQKLPEHMVPAAFVSLEAFPLTPNGKVDRRALPAPDADRRGLSDDFVAPRTEIEELLAVIWSQALGMDQVGIDDNFFSLGGDSIRSVQVLAKVQQRGLSLSLQDLFQYQTIRELAKVATATGESTEPTQPFDLVAEHDRLKLPPDVEDAYPLTMLQAGMVFHSELNPGSGVFHDIFSHHVRAPFNPDALRAALESLVQEHAALRTCFSLHDYSEPLQLVLPEVEVPLRVFDLRDLAPQDQDRFLRQHLETVKNEGFDWGRAPLVNVDLHRRGNDTFQFTISFHHAVLDGWSLASLLAELFQRYVSIIRQDPPAAIEPLAGSQRDYVAMELKALRSEATRDYWTDKLRGSSPAPLPRSAAAGDQESDTKVQRIDVDISAELSARLKDLARSASVPIKSVLLAAHLKVMSFISGEPDVMTGLISNGRPEEGDGERLLGLFLNTIPFRQRLSAGTWMELVQQTFQNEWEALPHRWYPLAQIQRDQGSQSLFETAFNFLHFHVASQLQARGNIELIDSISFERTNLPLIANFSLDLGTSDVHLLLVTDGLTNQQTEAIAGYYLRALTAMANEPEGHYQSTSLLSDAALHQLLYEWNATELDYTSHATLPELFEAQVERTPEATVLVFGEERISYHELNRRVNQLAHHLADIGVGPEQLVGVCVERSIEMVVAVLGVIKAGAAFLPLDPSYPLERLSFMVQDSAASVLLAQQALVDQLPVTGATVVLIDADWERIAQQSVENPPHRASARNLAYVFYTSGSTGRPKGVQAEHRAIVNRLTWMWQSYPFGAGEIACLKTRLSFVDSVWEMFGPMLQGVPIVIIPEAVVQDPLQLTDVLADHRVSRIVLVPSLLRVILDNAERLEERLSSLKFWITSGEALAEDLCREFHRRLPEATLLNLYGSSEVSADVTWYETTSEDTTPVPIGVPIANSRVYILDQQGRPVPVGVAGDLYVGGAGLARGYWKQPGMTAERFLPDNLSGESGERLFATGDRARYREDGNIEYLGRLDHQVKVRGFRIELGEIETQLRSHSEVRDVVVVARKESADDIRLIAYVVAAGTPGPRPENLRAHLLETLPDYMVPSAFVLLDEMPLTPSGKVNRLALPAPGEEALAVSSRDVIAPRNEIEQLLHSIFAAVLKVENFGVHDNFFALGGHSLLATQVVTRMREALQLPVPLRQLFTHPTVAQLARWVETAMRDETSAAPPLERVSRNQPLPLSFAQQRLWFIDQLAPGSPLYNMPLAVRFGGPLNVPVLEQAINEIVRRHETLRTTIGLIDGEPVQVIGAPGVFRIEATDFTDLGADQRDQMAMELVRDEATAPFNLSVGPLLRARLLRLGEEDHIALLTMHHVISDGWSMQVLLHEVALLYGAYLRDEASPLPELEIQYADYAVWQREWLQGEELERQLDYWRKQLSGAPAVLELPLDHARPAVQTHRGAAQPFVLPPEISERVRELGRETGMTTFMVLLAAWQVLLKGLSGTSDISVGTAVAGRTHEAVEPLIGFFVNTLVLRTDLSGDPTFVELLERVRDVCVGAYGHQEVPFEKLVEELAPERSLAHTPLFQAMLVMMQQQQQQGTLEPIAGLEVSTVAGDAVSAKYDLTLHVREGGAGLSGLLEYNTDIFASARAERMVEQWQRVLAAAVAEPQRRLSDLPLLSDEERQQVLVEWNATNVAFPSDVTIVESFEQQVERTPVAVALVFDDVKLTYAELNRRANQLAHHLVKLGVGPETLVGICMERSLEMVIGLLGILKAGGAYVPLDPDLPEDRLAFMMEDAGVPVLLTLAALSNDLPRHQAKVVELDANLVIIATESTANLERRAAPENLVYAIYTSGSTGRPKGTMNTHAGLYNRLLWMQGEYQLTDADRVLQKTPYSFDVSVWEFFWPLITGACLVVARPGGHQDPSYLVNTIQKHQITTLHFVPSMLQAFLEDEGVEQCRSVRQVISSGEALPFELQERFFARLNARLHNLYGPTEASIDVTAWECQPGVGARSVPIGRPIANTQIYLLDEMLHPVPIGVAGELHIGGTGLGRGYLNRPDLTAEKFVPDPYAEGQRIYKTGDLARHLPDGEIEYLGRIDHQVKIRGFRIELGEIEARLLEHPDVAEVVVVARQEDNDQRIVAYLVARGGSSPAPENLRAHLRETLPDYMVPSAFVLLDEMPLTPNGKLDRRALPDPGREALAVSVSVETTARTQIEQLVHSLWARVLRLESFGIHDDFFALGGHSLLAMQVIMRMRSALNVAVPVREFFLNPTVAKLGQWIETALRDQSTNVPPLERVSRSRPLPLSFAQQRLWFIDQLAPGKSFYNMPLAVVMRGAFDVEVLERALSEVIRRHEVLRTTFELIDGEPVQVIAPPEPLRLEIKDLTDLDPDQRDRAALELANAEADTPFDLARGPLLRARLLRLKDDEHVGLLTVHHVISDGWSMDLFMRELVTLYGAFSRDQASPFPELEIQYGDYAVWQREWLQGDELERQLSYWRKQLSGAPPMLELPQDFERPAVQTHEGATHQFDLGAELSNRVRAFGRETGMTTFMVLLAAWQVLLKRLSRANDISVATVVAGRTHPLVEPLIGLFVNTLVLRTKMNGDPTFAELLQQVREVCLEAYSHQDVPFEKLVEELAPERSLARSPLFQVMMVMQEPLQMEVTQPVQGLTLSALQTEASSAKFYITMYLRQSGEVITGALEYNTDIFAAERMTSMVQQWQRILWAAAGNPEQRISELPLLSDEEQQRFMAEWNGSVAEYPADATLFELFEKQAERTPEAVALACDGSQLTYGELNAKANQLAHHLVKLGVGPEQLVGVCMERSAQMVVALLGVLKAGGAYVPLDPAYPKERLAFMVDDARMRVIVAQDKVIERLPEHTAEVVCLDSDSERISLEPPSNAPSQITADNTAYVIYTSGSTGKPKGVCITHRNVVRLFESTEEYFHFGEQDVWTLFHSYAFDFSVWELWGALLYGGKLVVVPYLVSRSPEAFYQLLQDEGVTVLNQTPSAFRQLMELDAQETAELSLRLVIFGGEALDLNSLRPWFERHGDERPELVNMYGITETTVHVTYRPLRVADVGSASVIGRALPDLQVCVLDEQLRLVPAGVTGEMYVGGAGLGRGYLNRPQLTAERFIPDPFSTEKGARLYKTGDLARFTPSGELEYLGRADDQVKIRGFRIELGEIEGVLNQHPQLTAAAVVRQDGIEPRLAAYVVSAGAELTAAELRQFTKDRLPDYMVPSVFVMMDHLPLTANGKIDRRALQEREHDAPATVEAFVPPRDVVELQIAQIWEDILGVKSVSVRDNFFDLGGHSFLAVRLMARIKDETGKSLPLAMLMQEGTIESVASELRQMRAPAAYSPLVPIRREGSAPAFFCVHPAGGNVLCYAPLAQHLGPEQPFYAFQARGFEDSDRPLTSIEALAVSYVEAMRAVQPEGPYFIGGWSVGGSIAFEMSRVLQAQEQQVALLALFDSHLLPDTQVDEDEASLLISAALHLGLPAEQIAALQERLLASAPAAKIGSAIRFIRGLNLLPPGLDEDRARKLIEVLRANLYAARHYSPQPADVKVTFFKANHSSTDPVASWIPLARRGVEVHEVDGDHFTMMHEPYVAVLAAKLVQDFQNLQDSQALKASS